MATTTENRADLRGVIVLLPAELHRELKMVAAQDDKSVRGLVMELIVDYLHHRQLEDRWTAVK